MTVEKLIQMLQQFPGELRVVVLNAENFEQYNNYEIDTVRKANCEYLTVTGIIHGNSLAIQLLRQYTDGRRIDE
jgi:hypothetical protein